MKQTLILFPLFLFFISCSTKNVDTAQLAKANEMVFKGEYEQGITLLDELAEKFPDDLAIKQSRIESHLKYATYFMYNDSLPPRKKYPAALKHYRKVLSLDPNNAQAKQEADLIISIYKDMGKEVPQE